MKSDLVYLQHIRDCILRIGTYTVDGRDYFNADTKTQDAVIRNMEIIGEAVKKLSAETLVKHPEIPWKRIAGMRDILIHHYFGVKLDAVWEVVESHLVPLLSAANSLISELNLPDNPAS